MGKDFLVGGKITACQALELSHKRSGGSLGRVSSRWLATRRSQSMNVYTLSDFRYEHHGLSTERYKGAFFILSASSEPTLYTVYISRMCR